MSDVIFPSGRYVDGERHLYWVEVDEEGCIFCGCGNGIGILCEYPLIGEFCDNCPLEQLIPCSTSF